jgi:hypothetical protein
MTQKDRLLEFLKSGYKYHSCDLNDFIGWKFASIVSSLRKDGYQIEITNADKKFKYYQYKG